MTKVYVYVEGPSDKAALQALLAPLLKELRDKGILIIFFDVGSGDRKKSILLKVPDQAVNILRSQPRCIVVAMPDLYPQNRGFPHVSFAELEARLLKDFRAAARRKNIRKVADLEQRFRVFCFKHDMEVLLLAAFEPLKARLGTPELRRTWSLPVEDVNHNRPPKRVVEELFQSLGQKYQETVDASLILADSNYRDLAEACPQCFRPFVQFLDSLHGVPSP